MHASVDTGPSAADDGSDQARSSHNKVRILIANPNSSVAITNALKSLVVCPPDCALDFFTGPSSAPTSIDDDQTSRKSEEACTPELERVITAFDAVLIACYSDHPLVHSLRERHPEKHIVGIFEASIVHALLLGKRFGIVTTGEAWESVLSEGVASFLGFDVKSLLQGAEADIRLWRSDRFVGVASTGLGVNELHEADPMEVSEKIGAASRKVLERGADVICLGCAGMSGMEDAVRSVTDGSRVVVVDGVQAGVDLLAGLGRRKATERGLGH